MLLARFPGLAGLAFADGTPFADAATTSWMELQVEPLLSSEPAPSKKAAVVDSSSGEQLAAQYEEARSMVAKNNLSGALEIMEQGGADDSDRDRFRRRLHVASLCVTGGKPAVARPILESLDQQVREHRLDTWESSLALEVWTLLYRCYGSLAGSGDAKANPFQAKADDIFDRICGLDPQFALDMSNR